MRKSDYETVQCLAQDYINRVPVIIIGSGASIPYGIPGMVALGEYISQNITPKESDKNVWEQFLEMLPTGLELALTNTALSTYLTEEIVKVTRSFLLPSETRLFESLINGKKKITLTRLFHHLFNTIHKEIHVVTTNYDRLVEFAADCGGFACQTGFTHGHIRYKCNDTMIFKKMQQSKPMQARTVCTWKVHGSLDWFITNRNQVIALPSCIESPDGCLPAMVTPGVGKYKRTHEEPYRTIITQADSVLTSANSYFCIGYGFNDDHIQPKLVEQCQSQSVPIVVLAKTLSETAKDILLNQGLKKFLVLEEYNDGTKAYFGGNLGGVILSEPNLWELGNFLDMTIGRENDNLNI